MLLTQFYINGKLVGWPTNGKSLAIQLNYGKDQFPNAGVLTTSELTWVGDEYQLLMAYKAAGISRSGPGITEGPGLQITITENGVEQTVFNGYISFKGAKYKDRISITTKVVNYATVDWLNEIAKSFTFEYLASLPAGAPGAIDSSMYVFVPYCLSQIPNYEQAAIATLTVFGMEQSIEKQINAIIKATADISGVLNSPAGVVKLILEIVYTGILLAAMIAALENIYKFIIGPVKYHAGMYHFDLLEKGAEFLNMKLVCDFFDPGSGYENEIIIPPKLYNAPVGDSITSGAGLLGFLTPDKNNQLGWFKGSYANLLEITKTKFNAKIIVTIPPGGATPTNQGTITIIRRDKSANQPQYTVTPNEYVPDYVDNSDEAIANYEISFLTDSTDMNTLQNYQGNLFQVITSPVDVTYQPFVTLNDFEQAQIQLARASTKKELSVPETIWNDFQNAFVGIENGVISIVNTGIVAVKKIVQIINKVIKALKVIGIKIPTINTSGLNTIPYQSYNQIENRIGMMILSQDHFETPKVLCIVPGSQPKYTKLDPNNDQLESAQAHWYNWHYVNSIVPKAINPAYADRPYGNQFSQIKVYDRLPFTWNDFLKVVQNNIINAPDGITPAIMESCEFFPPMESGSSGTAKIKVRFYGIWQMNLQETFLNPTGA